ncbi:MAG: hypothetical protein ACI8W8_000159 [Rhodothermales bacterium]|jgi:hypothetical protein
MQKLVTIYLDNSAYLGGATVGNFADKHALVEEHLQQYLSEGWTIGSVSGLGGSHGLNARGWIIVLLEKNEA